MHVVYAGGSPKRSERQLRSACRDLPGILVLNAIVEGEGGRTREIDGVLLTPSGVFTAEVKGTQLTGVVLTDTNRPWTIGGKTADFYGSPNPLRQARTAAQALAGALRTANIEAGFISPIVAISGNDVDVAPHRLGDTWVLVSADIAVALAAAKSRPLTTEVVAQVCRLLGVDVSAETAVSEGFRVAGSREARTSRNQQLRTAAEDALRAAVEPLPGLLIIPGERSGAGPDVSAVLLTPGGVFAVKAKATSLRGELDTSGPTWTVNGSAAHFGRGRAEDQARSMAAWLNKQLRGNGVHLNPVPVVAIAGAVQAPPHRSHGAWVTATPDLAGVLLRAHRVVSLEEALAVCAALGHKVSDTDLRAAGFTARQVPEPDAQVNLEPRPAPSPDANPEAGAEGTGGRRARRAERLTSAQAQAVSEWQQRNTRRVVGSAGVAAVVAAAVPAFSASGVLVGLVPTGVVALWQLWLRRRYDGPRARGPWAAAGWLLTLSPVLGLSSLLVTVRDLSAMEAPERGLALMLVVMLGVMFASVLLLGQSSFIYPPARVLERYDRYGRATGTYALEQPRNPFLTTSEPRTGLQGDWRPGAEA